MRNRLINTAAELLDEQALRPIVDIDAEVSLRDIAGYEIRGLMQFEPCGQGKRATKRGGEKLLAPLVNMFLRIFDMNFPRDDSGQGHRAPLPKARRGGARDARDGCAAAVLLDGETALHCGIGAQGAGVTTGVAFQQTTSRRLRLQSANLPRNKPLPDLE